MALNHQTDSIRIVLELVTDQRRRTVLNNLSVVREGSGSEDVRQFIEEVKHRYAEMPPTVEALSPKLLVKLYAETAVKRVEPRSSHGDVALEFDDRC